MVVVRASLGKIGLQSNKDCKNMFETASVTFFRPQNTQLFLFFTNTGLREIKGHSLTE